MTARRQARVAATRPYADKSGDPHEVIRAAVLGADAASDVWEPEVERWRKHARNLTGVIDAMLVTGSFTSTHKEILDEVKEALK